MLNGLFVKLEPAGLEVKVPVYATPEVNTADGETLADKPPTPPTFSAIVKGTGNMELTLDRNLANQRIWPALNIAESGTRKEEKLLDERSLKSAVAIRRHLMNMPPTQAMKNLI